jgi:hypothetical protein
MIFPTLRPSLDRAECQALIRLIAQGDRAIQVAFEDRLERHGPDALLDDPRTLNVVLAEAHGIRAGLVFYVLVRHALLRSGVTRPDLSGYVAQVVFDFAGGRRAYRPSGSSPDEYRYLTDLVIAMDGAPEREKYLLRLHLGNYSLWLAGIFPDHIEARRQRKGAPGLSYYEGLGANGYRQAAAMSEADDHGLAEVYLGAADAFRTIRIALNRMSDAYFFPGHSTSRLLRQVTDSFVA